MTSAHHGQWHLIDQHDQLSYARVNENNAPRSVDSGSGGGPACIGVDTGAGVTTGGAEVRGCPPAAAGGTATGAVPGSAAGVSAAGGPLASLSPAMRAPRMRGAAGARSMRWSPSRPGRMLRAGRAVGAPRAARAVRAGRAFGDGCAVHVYAVVARKVQTMVAHACQTEVLRICLELPMMALLPCSLALNLWRRSEGQQSVPRVHDPTVSTGVDAVMNLHSGGPVPVLALGGALTILCLIA